MTAGGLFLSAVPAFPLDLGLALAGLCGLRYFVETGTYRGETARAVAPHFERVLTIEGVPGRAETVRASMPAHVEVWQGDSGERLGEMLATLDGPALLWLDAHWIYNGAPLAGDPLMVALPACPLARELEHLRSRPADAVMIDDAHFFTRPPIGRGPAAAWPSLDRIVAALPSRFVFIQEGALVAVPECRRAAVTAWLLAHPDSKARYHRLGMDV